MSCRPWCIPLIIYAILSGVTMISSITTGSIVRILGTLVWNLLWGLVMYWMCMNCKTKLAWVLLILPIIIPVLITVGYILLFAL